MTEKVLFFIEAAQDMKNGFIVCPQLTDKTAGNKVFPTLPRPYGCVELPTIWRANFP
jgi:hypothetical protein